MRLSRSLALLASFPLTLFSLTLVRSAVSANPNNAFQICAAQLRESGIAPAQIASACSQALNPQDLSECVSQVSVQTPIQAGTALTACFQVRRPVELAQCAINIQENTPNPDANLALDYCRRSLLPTRFSDCVVGLTLETAIAPTQAMESCIAARSTPTF